ncbi:AvrD family protein [Thermobifida cellulosilytica]|mgnify:FL=1|uniref:Avirulence D protein (AvrD) n=1 Tax=Thermobifida cellulosilytica TB100 TaxID=665004 RepID=A0A147KLQ9_THECS|nr:AvrD family protein [Thermobifida cellulosilytica]KUP98193.1 hypothetical protein AC529_02670 [Thermobifida cellulosilytica TB100]
MTVPVQQELHYNDVQDFLGPGRHRFFGEGYKRADHRLDGLTAGTDADGPWVRGTAAVTYPQDWSRKGTTDQLPHLSTIDVLLLGVQLSELVLTRHVGFDAEQRRTFWVRRARIRAGSSPVEEQLAGFPVSARLVGQGASPSGPDRATATVDCTVGTLRIRTEIDCPAVPGTAAATSLDDVLRPSGSRPFGDAYRSRRQHVEHVVVGADRTRATAQLRVDTWGEAAAPGDGTEEAFQPSVGLIDVFVTALQLGQIMLYELDGIARADSNTLWMRRTRFEAARPQRPVHEPIPVTASLVEPALLRTGDGETWRSADISAVAAGIRMTCSVAHRLP